MVLTTCSAEAAPMRRPQLPAELVRARQLRQGGLALSTGLVAASAAVLSLQPGGLQPPEGLAASVLPAGGVLAVVLLALSQSRVQTEVHNGRLYISFNGPLSGPPVEAGSIEVCTAAA